MASTTRYRFWYFRWISRERVNGGHRVTIHEKFVYENDLISDSSNLSSRHTQSSTVIQVNFVELSSLHCLHCCQILVNSSGWDETDWNSSWIWAGSVCMINVDFIFMELCCCSRNSDMKVFLHTLNTLVVWNWFKILQMDFFLFVHVSNGVCVIFECF